MKKIIFNLLLTVNILSAIDSGLYMGANKKINNDSTIYKIGYLKKDNKGRFELYYKEDNIFSFETTTVGFRGENTFLPFGESSNIRPFFGGGIGGESKRFDYLVYEFSIGVHYFIHESIDISGTFFWKMINPMGDGYDNTFTKDGIEIGVNYHF